MPSSRVRATNASKSSNVPRSGWMASWPPSAEPMAHGEPGSPGCGLQRVVPALAERRADRVDRRQVDDVEAHLRDRVQPPGRGAQRPRHRVAAAHRVDLDALGPREELVPGPVQRAFPVDDQRHPPGLRDQRAQRVGPPDPDDLRLPGGRQAVPRRAARDRGARPPPRPARRGPRPGGSVCRPPPGRPSSSASGSRIRDDLMIDLARARTGARPRPSSARCPGRAAP